MNNVCLQLFDYILVLFLGCFLGVPKVNVRKIVAKGEKKVTYCRPIVSYKQNKKKERKCFLFSSFIRNSVQN